MLITATAMCCAIMMTGCATEYYQPKGENDFTKVEGKVRGPVKREGFISWSDGTGKNMPLSNISLIGK